jgi:hypothetical protein
MAGVAPRRSQRQTPRGEHLSLRAVRQAKRRSFAVPAQKAEAVQRSACVVKALGRSGTNTKARWWRRLGGCARLVRNAVALL